MEYGNFEVNFCPYCGAKKIKGGKFCLNCGRNFEDLVTQSESVSHIEVDDGLKWKLTKDGTIEITEYSGKATEIVIPDVINGHSVTSIGDDVFRGCNCLTSIVMPSSIINIGSWAFYGCRSLTSIEIPSSVTNIGSFAFWGCSSLTKIKIPSSVTSIGNKAFCGCCNLTICCEIKSKPSGWTFDWDSDFRPVVWNYGGKSGAVDDGIKWNLTKDGTITITKYSGKSKQVVIPDTIDGHSVTSIGDSAFKGCSELTSIVIPSSVTIIGDWAFAGCIILTSIVIPNGVTSIGYGAFAECICLISVDIPSSVTSIGESAFAGCGCLISITVDINNATYKSDGNCIIEKATNKLILGCINSVIPNYVTSIGCFAFYGCNILTSIEIPSSVKSIGCVAFNDCSGLKKIVIPKSVTSIVKYAFKGCSSLTIYCEAQSQPSGWDSDWNSDNRPVVWNYGGECRAVDDGIKWKLTKDGTIEITGYSGKATEIVIPDVINGHSVTSIGEKAFYNCSSLTGVTIPSSVTSIGNCAFEDCNSLTGVYISDIASWCAIDFGGDSANPLYYAKKLYLNNQLVTDLVIPSSVTSIGEYAFYGCSSLTSIEIPSSVTSIGNYAFEYCSSLTSIEIPSSVTSISYSAFRGCSSLTSVEIPNSVTSIGWNAFYDCSSLTSVEIPNSVTSIGYSAFRGCSSLTSVEIPNSVTSIGGSAFSGCSSLTNIEIPSSVTSIGSDAFYDCSNLTSIEIPSSVTSIGEYAFYGCSSLTIYCEAESQPSGWDSRWNYSNRPVVWNSGAKGVLPKN